MKIGEMEKMTGLSRDNIRFYEKEGLLNVSRNTNGYRDYTEEDLKRLKTILVLRHAGVPVAEIRRVFAEEITLAEALRAAEETLRSQMEDLNGSLQLCGRIREADLQVSEIDPDVFLHTIEEEENRGTKFMTVTEDVLAFSRQTLVDNWGRWNLFFPMFIPPFRKKKGNAALALLMIAVFVLNGGIISANYYQRRNGPQTGGLLRGILSFAALILLWLVFQNIIRYFALRHEKHQKVIRITGTILSCITIFSLMGVLILFWAKILYFHPNTDPAYFRNENVDSVMVIRRGGTDDPEQFIAGYEPNEYEVRDREYIAELLAEIRSCVPTGEYSLLQADPPFLPYVEITLLYPEDNNLYFYVYEENGRLILDEPDHGRYAADKDLMDLLEKYDDIKELFSGYIYDIQRLFDNHGIIPSEDGSYIIMHLYDQETNQEITEQFLQEYQTCYENEDYLTIHEALKHTYEIANTGIPEEDIGKYTK